MFIYHYHPRTKEFIATTKADIDPMATKREGKEVYMLPANATFTAPPECLENEVCVFKNEKWLVIEDIRKTKMIRVSKDSMALDKVNNLDVEDESLLIDKKLAEDIQANPDLYKIVEGEIIKKSNDDIKQEQQDIINILHMTKLDFVNLLENLGISCEIFEKLLDSNREFKKEFTYCANVYCGAIRKHLPITLGNINITDDIIVKAFKAKCEV